MRISKKIYEKIINEVRDTFPEMGGILGGIGGIITHMCLDNGIETNKKCSYAPNVVRLNEIINVWNKNKIEFLGLFHTHCYGNGILSEGDQKYIKIIMNSMPKTVEKLYFPVIVFPNKEIVAYSASFEKGQLIIKEENILLEEDL